MYLSPKILAFECNLSWRVTNVFCRMVSEKPSTFTEKTEKIEQSTTHILETLCDGFSRTFLNDPNAANLNKTHFAKILTENLVLEFSGQENVQLADVICGDVEKTMVAILTDGINGMLYPAFLIFTCRSKSYPIHDVLCDIVPVVANRNVCREILDCRVMVDRLSEKRLSLVKDRSVNRLLTTTIS